MTSTLRLDDCGDFLSMTQYCHWRGEAERTVRRQIRLGTVFVMPCEERPRIKFRRSDCEKAMQRADVIRERQARAKRKVAA